MGLSNLFYRICCCGGEPPPELPLSRPANLTPAARSRDSIYDPVLADSEREAVADLLGFLENVPLPAHITTPPTVLTPHSVQRPTSSPASPSAH
jgi:hypothetical protein